MTKFEKKTVYWTEPARVATKRAKPHTLGLLALTGSRAYGTNSETSDYDYRGVYVASVPDMLSLSKPKKTIDIADPDITLYELEHFCKLAADANPGLLEVLWAPRYLVTPAGSTLRAQRGLFLSKKIHAKFGGYARAQMKKAQEGTGGSRGANHHKRLKFKLHTLRLLDAGIEGLTNGRIQVRHPDPEHLWRMAALDIDALQPYIDTKIKLMDQAYENSTLPDEPAYEAINEMIYKIRLDK